MSKFREAQPYLLSILLVLLFPFFAVELIEYVYGRNPKISSVPPFQDATDSSLILFVLILLAQCIFSLILFKVAQNKPVFKKRVLELTVFLIPLFGYQLFMSQIFDQKNLLVGIHLYVGRNDLAGVNRMIALGVNPNEIQQESNPKKHSLLIFAAGWGHEEIVRYLFMSGADKNYKNVDGKTAKDFAVEHGHRELAKFL